MTKQARKFSLIFLVSFFFILLSLPQSCLAAPVTDEVAKQAGLSVGNKQVESIYDKGKYLGEIYLYIEMTSVNGKYIMEPMSVPLYKGDNLSRILNYHLIANEKKFPTARPYLFRTGQDEQTQISRYFEYTGENLDDRDFKINSVNDLIFGNTNGNVEYNPLILEYAQKRGYELEKTYPKAKAVGPVLESAEFTLAEKSLNKNSKWILYKNGKEIEISSSQIVAGSSNLQDGDVIRMSFSIFGDDRGYEVIQDKTKLIKKMAKINSFNGKRELLKNSDFKKNYEEAVSALTNILSSQKDIEEAVEKLETKPLIYRNHEAINFANYENHSKAPQDFLLSNLAHTMRVGDEMELFCLDLPRACDQSLNFQREDLRYEAVVGAEKIEIKRDSGDKINIQSSEYLNVKNGASFFARGLSEGFVKLKVTYPGYEGRPNYINIYITNRETDYGLNQLGMKCNLDEFIKYDAIHFNDENETFKLKFLFEEGTKPTVYGNGEKLSFQKIAEKKIDGVIFDEYKAEIKLKNFWTEVFLTGEKDGKKTSKIYNLRTSYIKLTLLNLSRPGFPIRLGDKFQVLFDGLLYPIPKIGKFYNPSSVGIKFETDFPNFGEISTLQTTATNIENGAVNPQSKEMFASRSGDIKFYNGKIYNVGYGKLAAWNEVPKDQMPDYQPDRVEQVISNVGGQNVPQRNMIFYSIPDFTIHVEENPNYHNPSFFKAKSDKKVYKPGDVVELNIDIPDRELNRISRNHANYIEPKLDDGRDNPKHHYSNQINFGRVIYITDIPGLSKVQTNPAVNTQTFDFQEKIERLNKLKVLKFKIPESTKNGTYTLKGSYIDVFYGPVWGMSHTQYNEGDFDSLKIQVDSGGEEMPVEKSQLKAQIEKAEKVDPKQYESSAWEEIQKALEEAKIVYQDPNTSQDKVEQVRQALEKALSKTKDPTIPVNKADLKAWIQKGQEANKDKYLEQDWIALQDLIEAGKIIYKDSGANQKEVDQVAQNIKLALDKTKSTVPNEEEAYRSLPISGLQVQVGIGKEVVEDMLPEYIQLKDREGNILEEKLSWVLNNFDSSQVGTYTALGFYQDPKTGDRISIETLIHVQDLGTTDQGGEKEEILSLTEPAKIILYEGQSLSLPSSLKLTLANGENLDKSISWEPIDFDVNRAGVYNLTGKIDTGLKVNQRIEVKEKEKVQLPIESRPTVKSFQDIQGHWGQKAIEYVSGKGLFVGVSEKEFAPNKEITRGEFITVLGRIANINPQAYTVSQNKNLSPSDYFFTYANWGLTNKIIEANKEGNFLGYQVLTREEMAKELWKTLDYKGQSLEIIGPVSYLDEAEISKNSRKEVMALSSHGLLKGVGENTFAPKYSLTRAEVAQILYNLDHK